MITGRGLRRRASLRAAQPQAAGLARQREASRPRVPPGRRPPVSAPVDRLAAPSARLRPAEAPATASTAGWRRRCPAAGVGVSARRRCPAAAAASVRAATGCLRPPRARCSRSRASGRPSVGVVGGERVDDLLRAARRGCSRTVAAAPAGWRVPWRRVAGGLAGSTGVACMSAQRRSVKTCGRASMQRWIARPGHARRRASAGPAQTTGRSASASPSIAPRRAVQ